MDKLKLMAKLRQARLSMTHESAAGLENAKNKGPDSLMLSGPLF